MYWVIYLIGRARSRRLWQDEQRREWAALRADMRGAMGLPPLPDPSIAQRAADERARRTALLWLRRGVIVLVVLAILLVLAFVAAVLVAAIQHGYIYPAHAHA